MQQTLALASINGDAGEALVGVSTDASTAALLTDPNSLSRTALFAMIDERLGEIPGSILSVASAAEYTNVSSGITTTWQTPDDTGTVVHPSVRYFPTGFAGHRWWAAATPYFASNNQIENPCIFYSDNGTNWYEPAPGVNPLYPARSPGYNSDTHLVAGPDGLLHLFFRDYSNTGTAGEKIRHMSTKDGIAWTVPVQVIGYKDTVKRLVSPAVWWDGGQWVMLAVEILAEPRIIQRFTAPSPAGHWTLTDSNVTVSPGWDTGRSAWHIDAQLVGDQVVMMVQDAISDGAGGDVYLCVSHDNGKTFTRATTPFSAVNKYRSCFLPNITGRGLAFEVWVGGGAGNWGVTRHTLALPATEVKTAAAVASLDTLTAMLSAKTGTAPFVFGDDFNRPDGVLGTAPSGQAWVVGTGTPAIVGHRASTSTTSNSRAKTNVLTSNYTLAADIYPVMAGGNQAWIIVRYVDGANYIRIGRDGFGTSIQRITAGIITVLHNFGNISPEVTRITVQTRGNQVTASIGALTATVTETQGQSSTEIGYQVNTKAATLGVLTVRT